MFYDLIYSLPALIIAAVSQCWLFTAIAIRVAPRLGIVDQPDNRRKVHRVPTPLMGGVAIFLSFALCALEGWYAGCSWLTADRNTTHISLTLFISAGLYCALGLYDDRYHLRPLHKFLGQIVAAIPFAASGTVHLAGREIGGLTEDERAVVRNENVGFVFQNFQLIPTLTAAENVLVPLELRGNGADPTEAAERVEEVSRPRKVVAVPIEEEDRGARGRVLAWLPICSERAPEEGDDRLASRGVETSQFRARGDARSSPALSLAVPAGKDERRLHEVKEPHTP